MIRVSRITFGVRKRIRETRIEDEYSVAKKELTQFYIQNQNQNQK